MNVIYNEETLEERGTGGRFYGSPLTQRTVPIDTVPIGTLDVFNLDQVGIAGLAVGHAAGDDDLVPFAEGKRPRCHLLGRVEQDFRGGKYLAEFRFDSP